MRSSAWASTGQFDPLGAHLPERLQGERLAGSDYVRHLAVTEPDGALTLRSETLGLELRAAPGREMRFRDRGRPEMSSAATTRKPRPGWPPRPAQQAASARVAELEALLRNRR